MSQAFYHGYSLRDLPLEALPSSERVHKGKHSYTCEVAVGEEEGFILIDVLLRARAFYVKRPLSSGKKGQVAWAKAGGAAKAFEGAIKMATSGASKP